jgi:hypothetical protein
MHIESAYKKNQKVNTKWFKSHFTDKELNIPIITRANGLIFLIHYWGVFTVLCHIFCLFIFKRSKIEKKKKWFLSSDWTRILLQKWLMIVLIWIILIFINIFTAICNQSCLHGVCTEPYVCTCLAGWNGTDCDQRKFQSRKWINQFY